MGQVQVRRAEDLSREVRRFVLDTTEALRSSASTIPFGELAPADAIEVLRIPFRQLPALDQLVLRW